MRYPIIDPIRTIRAESDVVEIDGIDREVWFVVERCPVYGVEVWPGYFASREEAEAEMNFVPPAPPLPVYGDEAIPF